MEHKWKLSMHGNRKDLIAEDQSGPLKTPCWIVSSHSTSGYGYAMARWNGRETTAHRVVWQIENERKLESDEIVMHLCDTPACVNPEHLRCATKHENTQDMLAKRRHKFGDKASWAKLNSQVVAVIRCLPYVPGMFTSMGNTLGVSEATIRDCYYGRTWKEQDESS